MKRPKKNNVQSVSTNPNNFSFTRSSDSMKDPEHINELDSFASAQNSEKNRIITQMNSQVKSITTQPDLNNMDDRP